MQTFKILSHNVYWLQGVPFETDQPGLPRESIVSGLFDLYTPLNIDLYCFQEIQSQEAANQVASLFNQNVNYSSGNELIQYGGLCSSALQIKAVDTHNMDFNRLCQVIDITVGKNQFRIANIHLPSNRQLGAAASQLKKRAEMSQLLETFNDIDIICGDFNNYEGSDIYQCLLDFNYVDTAEIFNRKDESSVIGDTKRRGDFIWVTPSLSTQVCAYDIISKDRLQITHGDKTYLSDHLPVTITLELNDAL